MVPKVDKAMADGVPGGLVAGHHHQGEEVLELEIGQRLAVRLGVEKGGDNVVLRVGPPLQGHLLRIAKHLECGRRAEWEQPVFVGIDLVDDHRGVLGIGIGDHLIAPGHQPPGI